MKGSGAIDGPVRRKATRWESGGFINRRFPGKHSKEISGIVVLSGTAKRKSLEMLRRDGSDPFVHDLKKNGERFPGVKMDSILRYAMPVETEAETSKIKHAETPREKKTVKLQLPLRGNGVRATDSDRYRSPLSKSFKILLECLKPYRKKENDEPEETNGCDDPWKAFRRGNRSLNAFEEEIGSPSPFFQPETNSDFLSGYDFISGFECNAKSENEEFNFLNVTFAKKREFKNHLPKEKFDSMWRWTAGKKIFTSNDFMRNAVFSAPSHLEDRE